MITEPIPVLLYHSVSAWPSSWIAPFTVSASTFRRHLELIAASGRVPMTVSALRAALTAGRPPHRPVVITFDDGFADTLEVAAPLLAAYSLPSTIYLTTGFLGRRSPGGDQMLDWSALAELSELGHEIGAHSVTHPQLDTLPRPVAQTEIVACKTQLEDALGAPVLSFAYPHGYSSTAVRRLVASAGYTSASAVRNAFSSDADAPYAIARLTVTAWTSESTVRDWLAGQGTRLAPRRERLITRGWRACRRVRAAAGARR